YSSNPLGKNPGDVWIIPNVKNNHVEKTNHPCQFPVELIERLVLSMSREGEWVLDPFAGVGTTMAAAVRCNRRGAGAEIITEYAEIARDRILGAAAGRLRVRERNTPVFDPDKAGAALRQSPWDNAAQATSISNAYRPIDKSNAVQLRLLEQPAPYKVAR
ncbi:MAG: DNA-methyltransferase, partial [Rudaea sp.]